MMKITVQLFCHLALILCHTWVKQTNKAYQQSQTHIPPLNQKKKEKKNTQKNPLTETNPLTWTPQFKKGTDVLEHVQRKQMELVKDLENNS